MNKMLMQAPHQALIADARAALEALQQADGRYQFDLEAGAAVPADYILLGHFLDEVDEQKEARIARYVRRAQNKDGSWSLSRGGAGDLSTTVKAYWALKLAREDINAPHMSRARDWVLERGGAAKANAATRIQMALFDQVPWRAAPMSPVETLLAPKWFPFHMSKVAAWSRAEMAPLALLTAHKARGVNPTGLEIDELFVEPPVDERAFNINPTGKPIGGVLLTLDTLLRWAEPWLFNGLLKGLRVSAEQKAIDFFTERLEGEDGPSGLYPAMANALMAYMVLDRPPYDPDRMTARMSMDKLLVDRGEEMLCQPYVSPVWDTCLTAHALMEAGATIDDEPLKSALDWLAPQQILDVEGDWAVRRPNVQPGGWSFQNANAHNPDVHDTAMAAMALHRAAPKRYAENIERAAEWIVGMQSASGGWGMFEADNEHSYLSSLPFADGAPVLDPPTADATARCVSFLAQLDREQFAEPIERALTFLESAQLEDGSWFGPWGANRLYGTWSALSALNAAGENADSPAIRRAIVWLKARQRDDGGWAPEGGDRSTASHTAWAMLALMAAGDVHATETAAGAAFLGATPRDGASWEEEQWTAAGFPPALQLKHHGYSAIFPIWALARYDTLKPQRAPRVAWGV